MSLWGRIFAAGYDTFMAGPEKAVLRRHREALLDRVRWRVLEIGGGTGANLPFYGSGIEELVITEPEEPMARRLERKLGDYSLPTRVVRAPAEELPFEDESFDFRRVDARPPARSMTRRARWRRSTGCSSRTVSSYFSNTSAPTSRGSPVGRTASTVSRSASGTAAIATAGRLRASKPLASRSRSSTTTSCAKRRRSCDR